MLYRSVYRTPVQVRAFAVQILDQALFHAAAVLPGGIAAAGSSCCSPMVVLPLSSTSRGRSRFVQWFTGSALALCCLPSSPVTLRSWPLVKARCICRRWVCINQFANVPAAGSYAYIRRTSDWLCKEHGLSVVTSQLYRCRKVERPRT